MKKLKGKKPEIILEHLVADFQCLRPRLLHVGLYIACDGFEFWKKCFFLLRHYKEGWLMRKAITGFPNGLPSELDSNLLMMTGVLIEHIIIIIVIYFAQVRPQPICIFQYVIVILSEINQSTRFSGFIREGGFTDLKQVSTSA